MNNSSITTVKLPFTNDNSCYLLGRACKFKLFKCLNISDKVSLGDSTANFIGE